MPELQSAPEVENDVESVFESTEEKLTRFAIRKLGRRKIDDAKDLVQETLLDGLKIENDGRNMEAFLRNRLDWKISNFWRHRNVIYKANKIFADNMSREIPPSRSCKEEYESDTDIGKTRLMVRQAVECLPIELKKAVTYVYLEELNRKEVAKILDISESALGSRLNKARALLKQMLETHS